MKGGLIVIDGIDGSGKATQAGLLVKRLKKAGVSVRTMDFPQYENNFFGEFIGECLRGKCGDFSRIDPRIASVLYAADRFESSEKIRQWMRKGCTVVLDRYVSSNQIHQGGKIQGVSERKKFLEWLEKMEYGVFRLPKPDTVFFLDVPVSVTGKLLLRKDRDSAEENRGHQEASYRCARWLAKKYGWVTISCVQREKLRDVSDIANELFEKVMKE